MVQPEDTVGVLGHLDNRFHPTPKISVAVMAGSSLQGRCYGKKGFFYFTEDTAGNLRSMEGNASTSHSRERIPIVVLALEAPRGAHASNVGARRNASTEGLDRKNYIMNTITINTGEDIREKILTYFKEREKISSSYQHHECMGMILETTGSISNPTINIQGSAVSYEGSYVLDQASGLYSLGRDGQVQQSGTFLIAFAYSDGTMIGGPVVGPLVAATPVQVSLGSFINEESN